MIMDQMSSPSNVPPEKRAPNAGSSAAEEKLAATSPNVEAEKPALDTSPAATAEKESFTSPNVAQEIPISERRQAYGTAKTENLRDSGLWRVILPGFVILCCLALLIIPLAILIPLLITSLQPGSPSNAASLTWLWIVMIIVVLGAAVIAIRGFLRIFMTQAQNYAS